MENRAFSANEQLSRYFMDLFGRQPAVTARAPGRVNLLGDHTDYNGGYVLPMSLPQQTSVGIAIRQDNIIRVCSTNVAREHTWHQYELNKEKRNGQWYDYVQAATFVLGRTPMISGVDMLIHSSVPLGAGLSSSASLLVAILRGLRQAFDLRYSEIEVAELAHQAESDFVGVPVGVMDPMVCALGQPDMAFFLDTATLEFQHVPIPRSMDWVIIHSGISHSHVTGRYRERRLECEEVCFRLGIRSLRDLEGEGRQEVLSRLEMLPSPLHQRARHVVMENERVMRGVIMLKDNNMRGFGELMTSSHVSLRDDYAVSVPETDLLVQLAGHDTRVYGARLTGGGFGGSVVIAVEAGFGAGIASRVCKEYQTHTGRNAHALLYSLHDTSFA